MKRNNYYLKAAQECERNAGVIRNLMRDEEVDTKRVAVLRFAGSLCSMASSILCELYECDESEFGIPNANNVLREWGVEELMEEDDTNE